ncbi:5-bromo-4-chloroindolyl phosphate hydrolysis family protein [Alisedimentitalea sp. MJ-SS2]|uniref:5-bromo-4-chloroindolyl phosphate hydrolysis family protein n=1 Tax=Aliisedimentitalea sp. MJ-SS2 TaxID=3049795 RepID=UPI0029105397|nr:5-bromo-4-chloroindolyl phosphate hydrolysis family protein [Alisedimentitalea sp. MJ-SS2]MDU8927441.1 5-bromo-4-chloroindolyl phosphate hydrolysis family protein [Alisedimentitalea sp. MJ-SS2]
MAQRYGGKHSPTGDTNTDHGSFRGASRTRAGGRVNFLFLAPLPLIWKAFTSEPVVMAQYLIALGLLMLAAWLTRDGEIAHEAYDARKVARRPAIPRKILGSLVTGAGLALAGYAGFGLLEAIIFAILGIVLHFLSFGPDPMTNKGMEGVDEFQTDRVARMVDQAEEHLAAMSDAVKRAGDRQVEGRVERFQTKARELLRTVEEDPRDLTAARKYMGVYLQGARDATIKFADVYARSQDRGARSDYMMLLTDLEESFNSKTQSLLLDNQSDMNVEIEVLRDRLAREGVRLNS